MAGKSLGTLTIDLIAEVGGFVKGMDQAERAAEKWRAEIIKDAAKVGTAFGATVSTITAGTIALIKSTSDHVTETDRWAKSLGISTSALMQWQYAAEKAGLSGDNIADIFKDLNDKIGDAVLNKSGQAAQALDTLGLSAKKLQALSPDKQLLEISNAMQGMNKAQQTNIFESLGNDLTKLSPLLDNNAEKLKSLMQNATDLGIAPKDEDVEKLLKVNQVFQDISDNVDGFKNRFAIALSQIDLSPMQESLKNIQNVLTDPQTLNGMANLVDGALNLANFVTKIAAGLGNIAALTGSRSRAISGKYDQSDVNDVQQRMDYIQSSGNGKPGELEFLQKRLQFLQGLKKSGENVDPDAGKGMLSLLSAMGIDSGNGYKLDSGEHNQKVTPPKIKIDHAALKLDSSFKSTEQAYLRQISLIDTTGKKTAIVTEQQKLAFDLSTGKLNGLNSAQQERLKSLAKEVDRLNEVKKANENNAKVAEYVNSLHKENQAKQQGLDADFIGAYSGNDQRSRLKDMASIKQDFASRQTDLQTQYDSGDIDKDLYDKKTKALSDSLDEQLSIQSGYYQKVDSLRGNYSAGFISGFADQAQAASDLYTNMQQVGSEAFSNLTDMIVNWAETGKLNAQDFAATFLESVGSALISYAAAQVAMAGLEAFTAMVGIPFVGPAVAPGAAIAAAAAAGVLAVGVGSALKGMAHDGIDSVPETGTWLLQKGERVTTAQTSAKLDSTLDRVASQSTGGNSYSPSLTFHVNGDPSDSQMAMMKKAASDGAKQGYQMAVNSIGTRTGDLHKVLMARTNAGVKKR